MSAKETPLQPELSALNTALNFLMALLDTAKIPLLALKAPLDLIATLDALTKDVAALPPPPFLMWGE